MSHMILMQARQHEASIRSHAARIRSVSSLLDLARLMGTVPSIPSYLRMLSDLRVAKNSLNDAAQRKGEDLLKDRLAKLHLAGSPEEFMRAKGQLLQDVRLLGGHLPRIVTTTPVEIARIEKARAQAEAGGQDQATEADRQRP